MRTPVVNKPPSEKIILALAEYEYLTALQITRLLYSLGSLTYVKDKLKSLVDSGYALSLGGRGANLPLIYTLSGEGRQYASFLGMPTAKRFRPSEEPKKSVYFMRHTLAINDVLISARLLSQTVPGIVLNNTFQERDLRRKIYVAIPEPTKPRGRTVRNICIEPDASLDFIIHEDWHEHTFRDFFHLEVYRTLPPLEQRFKQKVKGYVVMALTGQQEALFYTSALSIAVFAATDQQTRTLKRWTEEALQELGQPAEGQRFFFASIKTDTARPAEMYLAPVWQQAFADAPTPLLVLEERQTFLEEEGNGE